MAKTKLLVTYQCVKCSWRGDDPGRVQRSLGMRHVTEHVCPACWEKTGKQVMVRKHVKEVAEVYLENRRKRKPGDLTKEVLTAAARAHARNADVIHNTFENLDGLLGRVTDNRWDHRAFGRLAEEAFSEASGEQEEEEDA